MYDDVEWINKGTISWPRTITSKRFNVEYGRESNVLRSSAVFFGLYDPKEAVEEYNIPSSWVDFMTNELSKNIETVDKESWKNFNVKFEPKEKNKRSLKREFSASVSSISRKHKRHRVNLSNLGYYTRREDMPEGEKVLSEFRSFLNYRGSCTCESLSERGEICSMPPEYCSTWFGVSLGGYNDILIDPEESKFYGNLICRHQMKTAKEDDRYPHLLNEKRFYELLPHMALAIMNTPKTRNKIRIRDLDITLAPFIKEMGFGYIPEYIRENRVLGSRMENMEERIVRTIGRPYIRQL